MSLCMNPFVMNKLEIKMISEYYLSFHIFINLQ